MTNDDLIRRLLDLAGRMPRPYDQDRRYSQREVDALEQDVRTVNEAAEMLASTAAPEANARNDGLELGADMCVRMARSESSMGFAQSASILEAAAFAIRALKMPPTQEDWATCSYCGEQRRVQPQRGEP